MNSKYNTDKRQNNSIKYCTEEVCCSERYPTLCGKEVTCFCWYFRPCKSPVVLRPPLENNPTTDNDEDDELIAKNKDYRYVPERMTWDPNCYECKVRYRDPKAKDLVMYLHAWRYKVSKHKKSNAKQ